MGCSARLSRHWLSPALGEATLGPRSFPVAKAIPLYRDPCYGTFVSPEIAFPFEQAGHKQHFCSAKCRDRYLRIERHAAQA
jgi:hypothetical protein